MTSYIGKTIVAGPWVGEFGWELFAWQGYLRAIKEKYNTRMVIVCSEKSKLLYEDFADEFVYFEPPEAGQSDSFYMQGYHFSKENLFKILGHRDSNFSWLPPRRIGYPPATSWNEEVPIGPFTVKPKYIMLANQGYQCKYDIVIHARNRKLRSNDNWSLENWRSLLGLLAQKYKVACIGTREQSLHVNDTVDYRGCELSKTVDIIKSSRLVLGPSSGPMHLASLCGTPHLVWGSREMSKTRYEDTWNPLGTKAQFLDEYGWHPPPEFIYKKVLENVI